MFDPMMYSMCKDGLPIVELTTAPTAEGATLTAEESAQMDALNAMPAIVKLTANEGVFACVANVTGSPDGSMIVYVISVAGVTFHVMRSGGVWMLMQA